MSQKLQEALDCKLYTILNDRVLFYDGDTVITPDKVYDFVEADADPRGGKLCVTESNAEITSFNALVDVANKILVKSEFRDLDLSWNIPDPYLNLNVDDYIHKLFDAEMQSFKYDAAVERAVRVKDELEAYKTLDLYPILRVIIYVINTLSSHGVVWGIGRGSCVASYVLYLIGVHDVDSVLYELDYTDFLRESK